MAERSGGSGPRGFLARLRGAEEAEGPTEDATLDSRPERIGPYRVLEKLGQGGMGIVFSALDERLDRSLAIKVIGAGGDDDSAVRRFWREARAAAAVNHPHICQIYEVGEHEGQLFIAMERLEGESLGDRLERGPLPVREAVPLTLEILSALEALHGRGLVHRDLHQLERGLDLLEGAVNGGYNVATAVAEEPAFEPVRGEARFESLRERAEAGRADALAAYRAAGGERLLGV